MDHEMKLKCRELYNSPIKYMLRYYQFKSVFTTRVKVAAPVSQLDRLDAVTATLNSQCIPLSNHLTHVKLRSL